MAIMLQLIRANEFIRIDTPEHIDYEESKEVLRKLALSCHKRGVNRALLDLRTLPVLEKPWFTGEQLAGLVQTFHDSGFLRPRRFAVLYRYDIHRGIRNFAFFSRMKGMLVQAFTDFEAAMQWLSEEEAHETKDEGEVAVPISRGAKAAQKSPANVPVKQRQSHTSIPRPLRPHAREHSRIKHR